MNLSERMEKASEVLQEKTVEEPSILEEVISKTKIPEPEPIPKGYKELPAGVKRTVRINRDWIMYGMGEPYIVVENKKEIQYRDVIFRALPKLKCGKKEVRGGCSISTTRFANMETDGALWVKE